VRLVHHEEGDGRSAEPLHDLVLGQLLGREEDVLRAAVPDRVPSLVRVPPALGGVDRDRLGQIGAAAIPMIWSRCRAMSGETTTVGPSSSSAGT